MGNAYRVAPDDTVRGFIGARPYGPFASLRQGKEAGQRRLAFACSVREPTDLCIRRAWACLPVGKGGEDGRCDGDRGKLGVGRLVDWESRLGFDMKRRPLEGVFRSLR